MKVFNYISAFVIVCLIPMFLHADPAGKVVEGKTTKESQSETSVSSTSKENNKINQETPSTEVKQEPGLSKESVISSSKELSESEDSNINSMGKLNYLFYFIYKYKYQDKVFIEQGLEEKL